MKKLSFVCMVALAAFAFQACGDANDGNDANIESNTSTDNTTGNNDNMMDRNDSMGMHETNTANLDDDGKFMVKAASGGLMEVELGNLAKEKATNASVKEFAAMMVTDHSKANDELKALASAKNITLPTNPEGDHRDHINDLREKSGAEFDKAYMKMMVKDHKEDVDKFEEIAKDADNADLKAFASKTLPTLKKHLAEAERIEKTLDK